MQGWREQKKKPVPTEEDEGIINLAACDSLMYFPIASRSGQDCKVVVFSCPATASDLIRQFFGPHGPHFRLI